MIDRYFGKVVAARDKFTVVVNRGESQGVKIGDKFLIVGLGEVIVDPDTQEELERLEIVRGKVVVTHAQEKISTMRAYEYEKSSDAKEITKVSSRGGGGIASIMGAQETVTESIKPGEERLKALIGAQIGDFIIKL